VCHINHVTPLRLTLKPGEPIFDQVVFAATKAFVSGEYQPGQPFPSVRALATALKIHPNTAHKVVQYLIHEGWLEVRPGIGTVVANMPEVRAEERRRLMQVQVEQLVVEAMRVGLELDDILQAIEAQWAKLTGLQEVRSR
jgi:GntR family transcriptional regulator